MLRLTTNVTSVARQLGAQLVGGLAHVLDHLGPALGEHRLSSSGAERAAPSRARSIVPRRDVAGAAAARA